MAVWCGGVRAQGTVETALDSVRGDSGGNSTEPPSASPSPDRRSRRESVTDPSAGSDSDAFLALLILGGVCVTSPIWAPIGALGDHYEAALYFPWFPYDNTAGHMIECPSSSPGRPWSGRFNIDYLEPFNDLIGINGRLLLSTGSRFGLDAQASHFEERRPAGRIDTLWVGDCNLVFRFAQAEKAQFRAGLGFNWLDCPDPWQRQADFGFNFTYGADFFPFKPLVLSADFDAGTLGRAGLFRFRTTGGILLNRIEAYTGYEYLDIGRGSMNLLVVGLRAWF